MSKSTRIGKGQTRLILLVILLLVSLVILGIIIGREDVGELASSFGLDHRAYWAAARLLITGGNPYDRLQMLNVELSSGQVENQPIMVWSAPGTLFPLLPYALLPFTVSSLLWLSVSATFVIICGALLWYLLSPVHQQRYWLGAFAAVLYVPTLQVLKLGQISISMLLGVVGFLAALRTRREFLAGVAVAFLLFKPHITLLLLVGIAWWIVRERSWRVLIGLMLATALMNFVVWVLSPGVFNYFIFAESGLPLALRSATLGTWLRDLFGLERYWLQFLPSVIGLVIVSAWAIYRKGDWDWQRLLPALLLASTVCAPFGWSHDTVTLLPAVILVLVSLPLVKPWHRVLVLVLYGFAQLLMLLQNQLYIDNAVFYWYPLFLAALFFWQQWMVTKRSAEVPTQ